MASINTYNNQPSLFFRRSTFLFVYNVFSTFVVFNSAGLALHILPLFLQLEQNTYFLVNTIAVVIAVILYVIEFIIVLLITLHWANEYYEVTPGFIRHKYGYFYRKEEVFDCSQVQEITVNQTTIGRIFHFGTITVISPLLDHKIILQNIDDPVTIMRSIHEVLSNDFTDKGTSREFENTVRVFKNNGKKKVSL